MDTIKLIQKVLLRVLTISFISIISTLAGAQQLTSESLGEHLYLIKGAGANVIVYEGTGALTLIDGGKQENALDLLKYLDKNFAATFISTLINTHWHLDQTGLNEYLSDIGTNVIAHQNTSLWMGTEIVSKWNDRVYPPRNAKSLPTSTIYYDSEILNIGGSTLTYGLLPQAHTDGDLYVYFPEQNVMAAGDVITGSDYPVFDYSTGGWIGGMINSLEKILAISNDTTVYIPATGEPSNRSAIEAQLRLCQSVIRAITQSYYAGETYQQFLDNAPLVEFQNRWQGDETLFLHTAYEGAWGHVTELRRYR